MNTSLVHALVSLSCAAFSTLVSAACYPNRGDFDGSPDGVRVIKSNWSALGSIGFTKELKAVGSPRSCGIKGRGIVSFQAPGSRQLFDRADQISETQRCLNVDDYGAGSFDSTKSNYCKTERYTLVLHEESPNVWLVYNRGGDGRATVGLVAEFDKSGRRVPVQRTQYGTSPQSASSQRGNQTDNPAPSSPITNPNPNSNPNPVDDLVKQGIGGLLKGLGR